MADYVSQRTLRLLIIGLVCIAAIAVGAGTITSTVGVGTTDGSTDDGVDPRSPGGGPDRNESHDRIDVGSDDPTYRTLELEQCNEQLASVPGTFLYFGAIVALIYLIKRRYSAGAALIGTYALAPIVLTVYFLWTTCPQRSDVGIGSGELPGGGGPGDALVTAPEVSPLVLVGVFGVLLVAAAAVVIRASGDQTVELDEDEQPIDDPDVADLAAAAGAAADRLEKHNADVDNAVYRAWWEMTRLLDVANPASTTPGEFAAAAVDLGMSEDDVGRLTELFEEVRYGKRDPASREQRAIDVFRSVEAAYGTESTVPLELSDEPKTDEPEGSDGS